MVNIMRNLTELMDKMLAEIPDNFIGKVHIKYEFDEIKESISFTAPEAMVNRWYQVSNLLEISLGGVDSDWKIKIQKIFNDQED